MGHIKQNTRAKFNFGALSFTFQNLQAPNQYNLITTQLNRSVWWAAICKKESMKDGITYKLALNASVYAVKPARTTREVAQTVKGSFVSSCGESWQCRCESVCVENMIKVSERILIFPRCIYWRATTQPVPCAVFKSHTQQVVTEQAGRIGEPNTVAQRFWNNSARDTFRHSAGYLSLQLQAISFSYMC
jgi:hypothetical protein